MEVKRAIEILDPEHREHYDSIEPTNEACRMGIEALKRTRWTPVSEKMPEKRGRYLVAVKHWCDGKPVTREAFWNGADWLSGEKRVEITPRVTNWMSLPEPPEMDGGANNETDTVDAVPVVRCKDCEYWGDEAGVAVRTDGVRFARCKVHNLCVRGKKIGWCPTEDDFCSQGERRTDNENR